MAELSEKSYLAELISDFPASPDVELDTAWRRVEAHFRAIEEAVPNILEFLAKEKDPFPLLFSGLSTSLHGFLYRNVLSNAGDCRKSTDPRGGLVAFGPEVFRNPWGSQFKGAPPTDIPNEMDGAFRLLSRNDRDPVRTSIQFYQRFVRIHPYYDANGRIARLLVSVYLLHHDYYVKWRELEQQKKNEFLKKLNACHLREGSASYEQYFEYLHSFWREFVIARKELDS